MIVIEALLITCMVSLLAITSYCDCKRSTIPNKYLLCCGLAAALLDAVYYIMWAGSIFGLFVVNLLVLSIVGIIFYAYNLWAAGDCKLLFVVGITIPGRFYTFWRAGWGVSFYLIAFVFTLAFLYVVIESVVLGIKDKRLFQISFGHVDWIKALMSYVFMVGVLSIIREITLLIIPELTDRAPFVFVAFCFILVLTMIRLQEKLSAKTIAMICVVSWIALIGFMIAGITRFHFSGNLISWIIVLLVMVLRLLADKYNYKVILARDVHEGQILSASTVLSFAPSRVQGLPTGTSEDLRSRLTSEEADSVRRWASSSKGNQYIVIVRKIPFAVFISFGTILFIVFELVMA